MTSKGLTLEQLFEGDKSGNGFYDIIGNVKSRCDLILPKNKINDFEQNFRSIHNVNGTQGPKFWRSWYVNNQDEVVKHTLFGDLFIEETADRSTRHPQMIKVVDPYGRASGHAFTYGYSCTWGVSSLCPAVLVVTNLGDQGFDPTSYLMGQTLLGIKKIEIADDNEEECFDFFKKVRDFYTNKYKLQDERR